MSTLQERYKEVLTHPLEQDRDNYVNIVHGVMDRGPSFHSLEKRINNIKESGNYFSASLVSEMPEEAAEERWGYHGEIEQIDTFGKTGFVISPEPEDIKVAWYCDLGTPNDPERLGEWVGKHEGKIKAPLSLLTKTVGSHPAKYNEMVIEGDEDTEIQGVFYREKEEAKRKALRLRDRAENIINREDLPLVSISYKSGKSPESDKEREVEMMGNQMEATRAHLEFQNFFKPSNDKIGGTSFKPSNSRIRGTVSYSPSLTDNLAKPSRQTGENFLDGLDIDPSDIDLDELSEEIDPEEYRIGDESNR